VLLEGFSVSDFVEASGNFSFWTKKRQPKTKKQPSYEIKCLILGPSKKCSSCDYIPSK
jgi:hypothetical protein